MDCKAVRSIADVNRMGRADFIAAFGEIAEESPWVAEAAAELRPFASRATMIESFQQAVRAAPEAQRLALVRAHPDLATKARLTQESAAEQMGAGLDGLTAVEFAQFTEFNEGYKDKFGFPFIFAVKGANKQQILGAFRERSGNSKDAEFDTAIAQICRIVKFRLQAAVSE